MVAPNSCCVKLVGRIVCQHGAALNLEGREEGSVIGYPALYCDTLLGLLHLVLGCNARTLAIPVMLGFGLVPLVPQKRHSLA